MQISGFLLHALTAVTAAFGFATSALAQLPVCEPNGAGERVIVSCRPFSLFPSARFVADFGVDHLLKPAPPAFSRSVYEAVQLYAGKELADNPPLRKFLLALPPMRFTQLDRTTGTLSADLKDVPREFEGALEGMSGPPVLTLRMPPLLQGGYWRGPDVLQMAFWEKERPSTRLAWPDGQTFAGELQCLSLTPDGLLMRFTPSETPPILLLFRECPQ